MMVALIFHSARWLRSSGRPNKPYSIFAHRMRCAHSSDSPLWVARGIAALICPRERSGPPRTPTRSSSVLDARADGFRAFLLLGYFLSSAVFLLAPSGHPDLGSSVKHSTEIPRFQLFWGRISTLNSYPLTGRTREFTLFYQSAWPSAIALVGFHSGTFRQHASSAA